VATEIDTRVTHMRQIFYSDLPGIFSLGIMSRNPRLEEVTQCGNYRPILCGESLIITNISRHDLVMLGNEHQQVKVILGTKLFDDNDPYFVFQCIQDDKIIGSRSIRFSDAIFSAQADPFEIPYFDEPNDLIFIGRVQEISYFSDRLPQRCPYTKKLIDLVRLCEAKLKEEGKTHKFYWDYRGILSETLYKIKWL